MSGVTRGSQSTPAVPSVRSAPEAVAAASSPAPTSLFDGATDAPESDTSGSLGSELKGLELELQLGAVRAELDDRRAAAVEREARCQELERALANVRREAEYEAEYATDELVRSRAIAVADRDRAVAQHEEAVIDREAALRARRRIEIQRDEAIAQREAAEERRDEAIAQCDEAHRQRDEIQVARRALQKQLKHERAQSVRAATVAQAVAGAQFDEPATLPAVDPSDDGPATRGATQVDMWAVRVLGTTMAVCAVTMLLLLLKWLFGL